VEITAAAEDPAAAVEDNNLTHHTYVFDSVDA
jgi:hypothetical protein